MRPISIAEHEDIWARWRRGEPLRGIARALGRQPGAIWCVVQPHGGIAPRPRRRAIAALSRVEREEISRSHLSSAADEDGPERQKRLMHIGAAFGPNGGTTAPVEHARVRATTERKRTSRSRAARDAAPESA